VVELRDHGVVGSLVRVNRPTEIALVAQQDIDDTTRTFNIDFSHPLAISFAHPGAAETTELSVEPRWLTHQNEALLAGLNLPAMTSYEFAGAGGTKVQGFIVRPPNFDPSKKYPVKFLIHGGPQGAWGDAWSYRWNAELMAADGYVVVMVNPRGSTGYGQAFIDGVNGDWGGKAYVDLMKGLDAAEAQFPFIDKTRECALGASYGGYMANWVLTHTNRFKCIVTHDGMYNPAAAYGDTEEMWFNEWEFRRPGDAGPGQPWKYASLPADQDPFRKWSPMLHIQDAKTPTLVIHSQKDYRLDVSEGFQLFTALQRLGVPSEMLYFPDEGHWVLKPKNSELWYKTVGDWCDKWTKQ
jgi:dipeptidyl aminopeptidase/acylaminoacyl peptidase